MSKFNASKFRSAVSKYNTAVSRYNSTVRSHNARLRSAVAGYNQNVRRFNELIRAMQHSSSVHFVIRHAEWSVLSFHEQAEVERAARFSGVEVVLRDTTDDDLDM